jgi:hypothetical protein
MLFARYFFAHFSVLPGLQQVVTGRFSGKRKLKMNMKRIIGVNN